MQPQALQIEEEIAAFADLLKAEGVRSYLEIGSKFGGSLWRVGKALPAGSRIVSVDLPKGTKAFPETKPSLVACVAEMKAVGHDARIIWGDSTDQAVIDEVTALGPFDAVFIDANHTMPYVMKDWANYGPLSRIVAFHDIAWKQKDPHRGYQIEVPKFWDEIKTGFRHQEFKFDPGGRDNGIGVLWR